MSQTFTPPRQGRAQGALLRQPAARYSVVIAYIAIASWLVYATPRNLAYGLAGPAAFLLFIGAVYLIYRVAMPNWLKGLLGVLVLAVLMPILGTINTYYLEVATQVCIFSALALGLNIVVGFAGLLDLGYVAFYLVGAYTWAIFGSPQAQKFIEPAVAQFPLAPGWFFPFLFLAISVSAMTGIMLGLPVLRVRGDYLAVVTLGFGELVRVLANNLDKPINLTNGPIGITPIQRPPLFFQPAVEWLGPRLQTFAALPGPLGQALHGAGQWMANANPAQLYPIYFYFLVLIVIGIVITVTRRLSQSRIGRAWEAIREDEDAAEAAGVPIVPTKLAAFAMGASFAGAMGMLFAAKQVFINPESFTVLESIGVLAMVILGGMGSIPGAVFGATALTVLNLQLLPNISLALSAIRQAGYVIPIINYPLAQLPSQFEPAKYQRLVFGLALVIMMIVRPEGIIPAKRRQFELHEAEEEAELSGDLAAQEEIAREGHPG